MWSKIVKLVSGNMLNTVLNGVVAVYVARVLGPVDRGVLALAMSSVVLLAMVTTVGAPHAAAYYIRYKPACRRKILRCVNVILLYGLFVSAGLVLLGQSTFSRVFLDGRRLDPGLMLLVVAAVVLNAGNTMIGGCLIAKGDAGAYVRGTNAGAVLMFIVTFVGVTFTTWKIHGALFGHLVGQFVTTKMFRIEVSRYLQEEEVDRADGLTWEEFLTYGVKAFIGSLASLCFKRVDLFVVGYFLNPTSVGYYAVALSLRDVVLVVPRAMAGLIGGEIADRKSRFNGSGKSLFRDGRIVAFLYAVACALVALVLFPAAVPLVYGSAYRDAVLPAIIILCSAVPLGPAIIVNAAIAAHGKPMRMSVGSLVASALSAVSIWYLTKHHGLMGAVLSSIVASTFLLLLNTAILSFFVQSDQSVEGEQEKELLRQMEPIRASQTEVL